MTARTYGLVVHEVVEGRAQWRLSAEAHVMVRLKRIFPRVRHAARGEILLSDTPEVAADLAWVMERWPFELSSGDRATLEGRHAVYDEQRDTVQSILDGHVPPGVELLEMAIPPRGYQLAAAAIVHSTGRLLLTDELGLGKTCSGLCVLRRADALPAVVVTLTHLTTQWSEETARFLPWLHGHVVTSGKAYDPSQRRGAHGVDPDVLFVNYSKLAGWQDFLAGKVRTVIFDEAQELRHHTSAKYTAAREIARLATYRMGLTATPVYNYGGEIHNIVSVLADDALGDRSEFSREWCKGDGDKLIVTDPTALGSYLRDTGLMLGRTRRQVGRELPEVQRIPHVVDVDGVTLAQHTAGVDELAVTLLRRNGTNTELFRAAGEIDWRLRHATGLAKAKYVANFVEMLLDTDEPVVLFGWHRDVYERWATLLEKHSPVFYTGEESTKQKNAGAHAFIDGDTRLLIMSLRAGAGLDGLQEASRVAVFGELDWSPGVHEQCIGRLHRDGQTDPVLAYFLHAQSGSDPAIAEVLNLKKLQASGIVNPDRELIADQADTTDRVRLLAADYLRRKGQTSDAIRNALRTLEEVPA